MMQQNRHKNGHVIQTAGEIFSDKTAIELIRDPANPEPLQLVRYRQGVIEIKPEVSHAGRMYAPLRLDQSPFNFVRFPTRIAPPETAQELFKSVNDLLASHLGQLDACNTAMVCAIFSSWFWPLLPTAPVLWIFAPAGSPRNSALQLLALLCRRAIHLVGVRRGDLLRIPFAVQPTLLLDEPDFKPSMQTILQASSHRGAHVASSRGILEPFGPKIIFSQTIPNRTPLETDALHAALIPASRHLPPLDKKVEEEIADEFQGRFLGYFLRSFDRLQIPKLYGADLTLPMQNLASAFGAVFDGDDELRAKILRLLAVQDEEIRSASASSFDSIVIEALIFFIHQGGSSEIRMQNVAEEAAKIYAGRSKARTVSPESVGWAIKSLGIPSGRINKAGNGVQLTLQVCQQVHRLGLSYGVRAMREFRSGCPFCEELESATGQKKNGRPRSNCMSE